MLGCPVVYPMASLTSGFILLVLLYQLEYGWPWYLVAVIAWIIDGCSKSQAD